ncbi:MAG: hypothetical protein AB7O88_27030 [Reyranellaceae bacterium]
MLRALLTAAIAAAALVGCVPYHEGPRYPYGNPPGWIDRNRDGIDDRVQSRPPVIYNPPGWIDRNHNGVDDRVENQRHRGFYDRHGIWQTY